MFEIGLPPPSPVDGDIGPYEDLTKASFFKMELVPKKLKTTRKINLFTLVNDMGTYKAKLSEILGNVGGGSAPSIGSSIIVYALADSPVSETFSSQYDDSFLSKLGNVAGGGIAELRQVLGFRNLSEIQQALRTSAEKASQAGGMSGAAFSSLLNTASAAIEGTRSVLSALGMSRAMENLLTGHKIEFPKIWKDSNYSPSYTFTIRLYNPDPANPSSTFKYIVSPLCCLLLFCVPYTEDGYTYDWPFFCSAKAPGMFNIKYGAVSEISVIKGGDSLSIAFTQIPGIVDVRITIIDLFNTMLGGKSISRQSNIVDYLKSLITPKEIATESPQVTSSLELPPGQTESPRIPPLAQSVAENVNQTNFTSNIQSQWPSNLPPPSQELADDLYNVLNSENIKAQLRDIVRGMNEINNKQNLLSLLNIETPVPPLSDMLSGSELSKQTALSQYMTNPTLSSTLNDVLTDYAQQALHTRDPKSSMMQSILSLDKNTILGYAEPKLKQTIKDNIKLRLMQEYPNITDGDIDRICENLSTNLLTSLSKSFA